MYSSKLQMKTLQERLLGGCAKNLEVLRSLETGETGGTLHPLAGEENLMKKRKIKLKESQKTKQRDWGHSVPIGRRGKSDEKEKLKKESQPSKDKTY